MYIYIYTFIYCTRTYTNCVSNRWWRVANQKSQSTFISGIVAVRLLARLEQELGRPLWEVSPALNDKVKR